MSAPNQSNTFLRGHWLVVTRVACVLLSLLGVGTCFVALVEFVKSSV